jgi:hypothetical protein
MIKGLLVIIPYGAGKVWDNSPNNGPCLAKDAYTGSPFKVNRKYAEKFAERWVILSAKYGYIDPDFIIPGDYNVTFKDLRTEPVSLGVLKEQVSSMGLDQFSRIIGLGGIEYRNRIKASYSTFNIQIQFPFADRGLGIGQQMSLIKKTTESGELLPFENIRSSSDDIIQI